MDKSALYFLVNDQRARILAPFLQAWIFFGLLKEVLDNSGDEFIKAQSSDSAVGNGGNGENGNRKEHYIITTACLDQVRFERLKLLLLWRKYEPERFGSYITRCKWCFKEAIFVLLMADSLVIKYAAKEVYMSLFGILSYLRTFISFITNLECPVIEHTATPSTENMLLDRMLAKGWCPSLIAMLRIGSVEDLYFASNVNLPVSDNHGGCTNSHFSLRS